MKILKNCIKLSGQIKIYVPSTIHVNQSFDNSKWVDDTLSLLCSEFGGSTSSKALGAWLQSNGNLVKEDVTIVFSYVAQDQLEKSIDKIYDFCLLMKQNLSQEAIALEINGEMYFI